MSVYSIVLFVIVAILVGWLLWLEFTRVHRAERRAVKSITREQVLLDSLGQRYKIRIADWGPDFDGANGTLHRWRWAVVDADHGLRSLLRMNHEDPDLGPVTDRVAMKMAADDEVMEKIFMIGNSSTKEEALFAAIAWIERQENPAIIISGRDL